MNKIYKSIYNESIGAFVAVSEMTKVRGKRSSASKLAVVSATLVLASVSGGTHAITCSQAGGAVTWTCDIPTNNGAIVTVSGLTGSDEAAAINAANAWRTANPQGANAVALGNIDVRATGHYSIAIGKGAVANDFGGVALGEEASAIGHGTVALGRRAGQNGAATNYLNTFIGTDAGSRVEGSQNTALGNSAGSDVTGDLNLGIGVAAGSVVVGEANTAFGTAAGAWVQGNNNSASGIYSGLFVKGNNNIASGTFSGTTIEGNNNISFGTSAGTGLTFDTAAGFIVDRDGVDVTADVLGGTYQLAALNDTVALGNLSYVGADRAIAIGKEAEANTENSIAIGKNAESQYLRGSIAIGENAKAILADGVVDIGSRLGSVVIGQNALSTSGNEVVIGASAGQGSQRFIKTANTSESLLIGRSAGQDSEYIFATFVGDEAGRGSIGQHSSYVGQNAGRWREGSNNTALGSNALVGTSLNDRAVGYSNTAIGAFTGANLVGNSNTLVGMSAGSAMNGNYNVASGQSAGAYVNGDFNTANGYLAGYYVRGSHNISIGSYANYLTGADNTIAIGQWSAATEDEAIAIGNSARANLDGSVALGAGSVASVTANQLGYIPTVVAEDSADEAAILATTSTRAAVSVGGNGVFRQITNLAAGTQDSDAVNVSQLKSLNSAILNISDSIAKAFGGDAIVNSDGTITMPVYTINGDEFTGVGAAIAKLAEGWKVSVSDPNGTNPGTGAGGSGGTDVPPSGTGTGGPADILAGDQLTLVAGDNIEIVQKPKADNNVDVEISVDPNLVVESVTTGQTVMNDSGIKVGDNVQLGDTGLTIVNGPSVTVDGIDAGNMKIINVAPGAIGADSTDAMNGSQLFDVGQSIADALGGGSTVQEDGTVSAPTFVVGNTNKEVNSVGDAIDVLNQGWTLSAGGNDTQVQSGDVVSLVNTDGNIVITQAADSGTVGFALNDTLTVETVNATTVNSSSFQVVNEAGEAAGPSMSTSGINAGGQVVSNVADGVAPTDAANMGQLNNVATGLNNQINDVRSEVGRVGRNADGGTAAAMAMANLPQAWRPGQTGTAVGGSTYRGQQGYALGVSGMSNNGKWVVKGSVAGSSRGSVGAAVGAFYSFD